MALVGLLTACGGSDAARPPTAPATVTATVTRSTAATAAGTPAPSTIASSAPPMHRIKGRLVVDGLHGLALDDFLIGLGVPPADMHPGDSLATAKERLRFATERLNFANALEEGETFSCSAGLGYGFSDLSQGTRVGIADEAGTLIATTSLVGGVLNSEGCTFRWKARVPDAPFYRIKIGDREELEFSYSDLEAVAWVADATVG